MIDLETIKANRSAFGPSMVALIAANIIPLIGVLFWDWSVFNVVIVYWVENVIVGAVNILKMLTCSPDPDQIDLSKLLNKIRRPNRPMTDAEATRFEKAEAILRDSVQSGRMLQGSKFFLIPFFTVHYGIFCLVHGLFVFALLGGGSPGPQFGRIPEMLGRAIESGGIWALLALAASHLVSFFVNFIGKGEFRRTAPPFLMMAPYGRIVVLHVAILFGAFAIMLLKSPVFLLVLLIAGKIALDLGFHIASHAKVAKQAPPGPDLSLPGE